MLHDEYEIIKYNGEHKDQLLELLGLLWTDKFEINADYLDWKYYQNPYAEEPLIYTTVYNGQIVAARCYFSTRWTVNLKGEKYLCLEDADAVTHPDHRRHGLLKEMTLAALEDLSTSNYYYIITLSGNEFSSASNLKLGWRKSVDLINSRWINPRYTHPNNLPRRIYRKIPIIPSIYRNLRARYLHQINQQNQTIPFEKLDNYFRSLPASVRNTVMICKQPRPKEMAELICRIDSEGLIRHVRDEQFISWRYQNPRGIYRFIFYIEKEMNGYIVMRMPVDAKDNSAYIVDWAVTDLIILEKLLHHLINGGDFDNITIWAATINEETNKILQNYAFYTQLGQNSPNEFCPFMMVRPVIENTRVNNWSFAGKDIFDVNNWELHAIYSDAF